MEKLMKALLVFWSIVLGSMALKFLFSFSPSKIDFSFSDYIDTDAISEMLHLTPTNKKEAHSTIPKNEKELEIPHPETLYTFTCDAHMVCQKEANTYIVNVDGVDFIPSKAFILTCLANKQANKFCTFFTPLGHTESMKFSSIPMMHSYIDSSKNPEFNDNLKDWEKKRLEKAKEKIESSL
jgi:hypothetical protein